MARRRMFTAELIDSDRFAELPINVQMLYMYMSVHADDEGFVSGGRRMAKLYDCPDGLEQLEQSGFIIRFPSGVLVIVDWYINNTIRKDRSVSTIHQQERQCLTVHNGRYTPCQPNDNQVTTTCQPNDDHLATQNRIEENRIEKNRIDQNRIDHPGREEDCREEDGMVYDEPNMMEVYNYCQEQKLDKVKPLDFWSYYQYRKWRDDRGVPIQDWKSLIRTWNRQNSN